MFMKLKDADVFYEEFGEGFPLIFIHGYHIDHKCLSIPIERYMGGLSGFRRIYPDLPGMGETRLKVRIDSTEELFSILLEFIDRITEGKAFAVAGYSYGGYLARGVLRDRTDKVSGMFLLCPVSIPDRTVRILPDLKVFEKDDDFISTLSEKDKEFFSEAAVIQNEEVYKRISEEILEPFMLADRQMMKNLQREAYAFEKPVDNLNLNYEGPVQFLAGRQDSVVGYEDMYSIYNDYPHGELTILNKAGHNLQIERPVDFERILLGWTESVKKFEP